MKKKNNQFDILISTCDNYSDLWDANVLLLNRNWSDRNAKTYLVTDEKTEKKYDNIIVLAAGSKTEITERLRYALKYVESEYILFTLDDYFLTEKIDSAKIENAIEFMKKEKIDYLRLYPASTFYLKKEGAVPIKEWSGFFIRNMEKGNYKISLYPGLWRKDFMEKTLSKKLNAWQYEVELSTIAKNLNAKCAISNNNEFPFLDVIRKGKILNNAWRYFEQNPIYYSERKRMKYKDEIIIWIKTRLRHILPYSIYLFSKKVLRKLGYKFYS